MLKRLSISLLILSLFVGFSLPASAQTTGEQAALIKQTPTTSATSDIVRKFAVQDQEKLKWQKYSDQLNKEATRSGKGEPRCATIDANLKERAVTLDKNYYKAANSFKEADQRMTNTIRLARQYLGDEAKTAEDMLALFHEKIALFESQSKTFQTQQREAQAFACKNSQGKFNTELGKLKQTGEMNRKSMQDITSYYEKTLRPELARLTDKLKEVAPRQTPKTTTPPTTRDVQGARGVQQLRQTEKNVR